MDFVILIYIAAALPFFWGIAHLFPTKSVANNFGDIGADNKNIVLMEWITEGVVLIFIGGLVAAVTLIDPHSTISKAVYIVSSLCLLTLAGVSLMTGSKIHFMPFRLCPVIFVSSAVLMTVGWVFG